MPWVLNQTTYIIMNITFNEIPEALSIILDKIRGIEGILQGGQYSDRPQEDRWFTVDEICDYLPEKPAKSTLYAWIGQHHIPYHKTGKRLRFLKSEIDEWLKLNRRKSLAEIQAEAAEYARTHKTRF